MRAFRNPFADPAALGDSPLVSRPEAARRSGMPKRQNQQMARKNTFVSDLSGREILGGKGAGHDQGTIVLDVTDEEAEEMGRKGRRQARRGRRAKPVPSS